MKTLECIIFDVEHGFSAFIKSPNDYGLLIDCGRKKLFSPIKWIRSNYNFGRKNIQYFEGRRIAKLIITHLHADHLNDIGHLEETEKPKHLLRDKKTVKYIDKKIEAKPQDDTTKVLRDFRAFEKEYTKDIDVEVDWGFESFSSENLTLEEAQAVSTTDDKIINNRSFVTVIGYGGKKILFPGDIEVEGWEKILAKKTIKTKMKGISFFVASHHGHKSGFTASIIDNTGKPDLFIVSATEGDESVDTSYSKTDFCKGYLIDGDKEKSKMVSTRDRKQSIKVTINEDGVSSVSLIATPDNLNPNQKKQLDRHTAKILGEWHIKKAGT